MTRLDFYNKTLTWYTTTEEALMQSLHGINLQLTPKLDNHLQTTHLCNNNLQVKHRTPTYIFCTTIYILLINSVKTLTFFSAFKSPPEDIRKWTTFSWPFWAAMWRGVNLSCKHHTRSRARLHINRHYKLFLREKAVPPSNQSFDTHTCNLEVKQRVWKSTVKKKQIKVKH